MFLMSKDISAFELKPLGECVEVLDSLRKPLNSDARRVRQGNIPYYGANGQLDTIDEWIFNEDLVLVAEDGGFFEDSIRPISYRISGKAWVNNHAHVLRPKNGIDVDWLNFSTSLQDVRHLIKGATLKKLNQADLKKILIPCPEIDEQRRIVARIKECMERVEEIEGLQEALNRDTHHLPMAFRYDLWESCAKQEVLIELGEVVSSTKNGIYKPAKYHGTGSVLLRMFNINGADFETSKIVRMEVTAKEAEDYAICNGDIIVSRVNSRELVGKSCLVNGLNEPAVHEAMLIRLRVDEKKADQHFLVCLINSPQFLHELRCRAKHAIGQSSINQNDLLSSKIPLPSLAKQKEFIEGNENFSSFAVALQNECIEQERASIGLRESILRKAFAGEL